MTAWRMSHWYLSCCFSLLLVWVELASAGAPAPRPPSSGPHTPEHQIAHLGRFQFETGEVVRDFKVSYVTHGTLNENQDNVILAMQHFMGDHHDLDFLIGPGKALDTDKYFIVATDFLGNSIIRQDLTTGPTNSGLKMAFPRYTIRDSVKVEYTFLKEYLGFDHILAAIGASMGAMKAYQFAVSYPTFVRGIIPIAWGPATNPQMKWVVRNAMDMLALDPGWYSGKYEANPTTGVMTTLMGFVPWLYGQQWFLTHLNTTAAYQREKNMWHNLWTYDWTQDARDVYYQMQAWGHFNLGETPGFNGDVQAALESIKAKVLIIGNKQDMMVHLDDSLLAANAIPQATYVELDSPFGHLICCGFDPEAIRTMDREVTQFLASIPRIETPDKGLEGKRETDIALGQTIRFRPGIDAPVVLNTTTDTYEEGASFDPLTCAEEPCGVLLHNIFEPLVATSHYGRLEPYLATSWERLDAVTFRFTLRRDVTFHNGERFDAETVRSSLMRASQAYGATAWFPVIDRVEIIKPYVVDVILKQPDSLFLYRLGHIGLMQPPRYIRRVGLATFATRPVGTGAFQFERWDGERREVHLQAYPHYWRKGHPKIERLIYTYMDWEKALDLLIAGKLDLIRRLHPRKTLQFMQTETGKIEKAWLSQLIFGQFNLLKPETPLHDSRVRQAINLALNREDIIRYGLIGNGRLLGGYSVPEDPTHAGLQPYPFDVSKARQLLEEAGYKDGLTLSMFVDVKVSPKIENILVVSLRHIGIIVKSHRSTLREYLEAVYLPKFTHSPSPPSYDILWINMPAGTIPHAGMIPMSVLYSKQPNGSTLRDSVLDQLYEEAIRTYDPAKSSTLWKKLEHYVYTNHLLLTGYQEKTVFGAKKDLHFTPRTLMTFWDAQYEP